MLIRSIKEWKSFSKINEYGDEATSSILDYTNIMAYVNSMDSKNDGEDQRDDDNYLSTIKNISLSAMNGSTSDNI